eukprot:298345_1
MGLFKLCCVGFIGVILSFIGLIAYTAYDLGELWVLNAHGLEKCKSIPTPTSLGLHQECEDIQALSDGSMLLSCGHLHDVLNTLAPHYIPFYNYRTMSQRISKLPKSKQGGIYRIQKRDKYAKPIPMKLSKYGAPDFHPHGISAVKQGKDEFLFVVNHRRDGEYISVFKVDTANDQLKYWTSIDSDSFNVINNVAAVPDTNGNFYYTNWMRDDPGSWSGFMELFAKQKTSQVLFCQTPDDFLTKRPNRNVKVKCTASVDGLADANGVTLTKSNDGLLVVSGQHVLVYDINSKNASALTPFTEIDTIFACDNVNVSPYHNDDILVGCFPRPLGLLYALQRYPNVKTAGMIRVIDLDKKQSQPVRIDPTGSLISAVTGALRVGPYTVGVSVFDTERYMVCTEPMIKVTVQ